MLIDQLILLWTCTIVANQRNLALKNKDSLSYWGALVIEVLLLAIQHTLHPTVYFELLLSADPSGTWAKDSEFAKPPRHPLREHPWSEYLHRFETEPVDPEFAHAIYTAFPTHLESLLASHDTSFIVHLLGGCDSITALAILGALPRLVADSVMRDMLYWFGRDLEVHHALCRATMIKELNFL